MIFNNKYSVKIIKINLVNNSINNFMGKYKIRILYISNPVEINFIIKSLILSIVHKNPVINQNN